MHVMPKDKKYKKTLVAMGFSLKNVPKHTSLSSDSKFNHETVQYLLRKFHKCHLKLFVLDQHLFGLVP